MNNLPKTLDFSETITIAKDASLSGAIDLEGRKAVGFIAPAALEATTAQLSFWAATSLTGTYKQVKRDGTALALTIAVDDYGLFDNPLALFGVRYLKVRAETAAGAAVVQATAARIFTVIEEVY